MDNGVIKVQVKDMVEGRYYHCALAGECWLEIERTWESLETKRRVVWRNAMGHVRDINPAPNALFTEGKLIGENGDPYAEMAKKRTEVESWLDNLHKERFV